jgi:ATP-dependent RNA helicase SUPV3L1/SUV3
VFTDRMLHRRGREETLVLGAATMRPMVERLLPGASILSRPRLSQLTFAGEKKLTRLPRRSAIVVFSSDEVYAIAELIRRQRGGAAVVLGALSPRTRNAQVALYQSGDVDYLVATDAIGMGLNLDVDHIAFASDRKFDGYQFRRLNPSELAQIAGRAGRAMRDGTFGTTGRCPAFETELVQALETHTFEPVKIVQWRNTDLDFASIGALQATLAAIPTENGLTRAPIAEDILVLEHAARDDDVRAMAKTRADIERLWEVCQVPDYRKIAPATHAELVVTLFGFLMREGALPVDWFARQVAQADNTEGGIDTLSNRIAHIRTWTFAANRPDWLADPEHWQGVTRGVEDKLSDALHERLTERFVDRRTSVLMQRLRDNAMLEPEIQKSGDVMVEGHVIGRLDGFVFAPDASSGGSEAKALQNAAQKALAGEIDTRAARLSLAPDSQFVLASDGTLRWTGAPVGKLAAGETMIRPRVRIVADEQLTGAPREGVQARLDLWVKNHIDRVLGPLLMLAAAEDVTGMARGVAFQLVEALGVLERQKVADDVKGLDQPARASLRKYGVRFGAYHIYLPALLKPAPRALAAQLFALKHDGSEGKGLADLQHLAASGRTSIPVDKEIDRALYRMVGYRVCGERAVRVDILERLADLIRLALGWRDGAGPKPAGAVAGGGFTVVNSMTSLIGASGEDFGSILRSLGYRMEQRPKPPEPAAPTEAAMAAGEADTPAEPTAEPADAPMPSAALVPEPQAAEPMAVDSADVALSTDAPPHEAEPEVASIAVTADEQGHVVAAPSAQSDSADQPAASSAEAAPAAPETQAEAQPAAAEPELIEVWRPARPEGRRPPRGPRRDARRPSRDRAAGAGDAPAATPAVAAAAAAPPSAPDERPPRHPRKSRPERHGRDRRDDRPDRPERADRRDRPPRPHREGSRPPQFHTSRPERREKVPDPNSPFAKLASLKAQLEANKEGR